MPRKKRKEVNISIILPKEASIFKLGLSPIEVQINLQAKVIIDGVDVSRSVKVDWKLRLSWKATYDTFQIKKETSGNPVSLNFQSGGILRIRAAVVVDDNEYSTRTQVKIIGTNPSKEEINKRLDANILKAIAWEESTWRQFDAEGNPWLPFLADSKTKKSMRGLFQISERWWGKDKRITHQEYIRVAWQYDYNIETAKEILEFLHQRVLAKFSDESSEKQWDRTIKAYHEGESSFFSKEKPEDFWYVKNVKRAFKGKPWQKK